jgi:hypothetical protein
VSLSLILIIVVTVALILGPAMMLFPKPEQRRREQLRLKARNAGLRFTMRKLPALKTDMEPPGAMACYYVPPAEQSLLIKEWALMRTGYEHEGNFYRAWDWAGEHRPTLAVQTFLQQQVPALPDSVKAITYGAAGITVFWNEKEGEDFLPTLVVLLQGLQAADGSE